MKRRKRQRLECAGWKLGSTQDFLDVSAEELAFVEMKLALAETLRERRQSEKLTQAQLAKKLGSGQSQVRKMESADASVSMDRLLRALLALGVSCTEVG